MTRFYYAGLLLSATAAAPVGKPLTNLEAPTESEFRQRLATGPLPTGSADTMLVLGKMQLAAFLSGVATPEFALAMRMTQAG